MGWIKTYSARRFNALAAEPSSADTCLEDVARALALKCRFTGHLSGFYSVAEHSVRVARLLRDQGYPAEVVLSGLLHDVGEAYLPDVASPYKAQVFLQLDPDEYGAAALVRFADQERAVRRAIFNSLGLRELADPDEHPEIRHADLVLLSTEARDLQHGTADWPGDFPDPLPARINPLPWEIAEAAFLCWYDMAVWRVVAQERLASGMGGGA